MAACWLCRAWTAKSVAPSEAEEVPCCKRCEPEFWKLRYRTASSAASAAAGSVAAAEVPSPSVRQHHMHAAATAAAAAAARSQSATSAMLTLQRQESVEDSCPGGSSCSPLSRTAATANATPKSKSERPSSGGGHTAHSCDAWPLRSDQRWPAAASWRQRNEYGMPGAEAALPRSGGGAFATEDEGDAPDWHGFNGCGGGGGGAEALMVRQALFNRPYHYGALLPDGGHAAQQRQSDTPMSQQPQQQPSAEAWHAVT